MAVLSQPPVPLVPVPPPAPVAPPPPPSSATTAEDWATQKGHSRLLPNGQVDLRTPDLWKFRAAKAVNGWAEGQEVSEEAYDAAIAEIEKVEIR